jgi:hypothetical protein
MRRETSPQNANKIYSGGPLIMTVPRNSMIFYDFWVTITNE